MEILRNPLHHRVNATIQRWNREGAISMCQAMQAGAEPYSVVYPTGLVEVHAVNPRNGYKATCSESWFDEIRRNEWHVISG